jgi:hypothetical protein
LEFITLPEKHYAKRRIVMCLSTRSKSATMKASNSFASILDDFWLKFRISNIDVSASNLLVKKPASEELHFKSSKTVWCFKQILPVKRYRQK